MCECPVREFSLVLWLCYALPCTVQTTVRSPFHFPCGSVSQVFERIPKKSSCPIPYVHSECRCPEDQVLVNTPRVLNSQRSCCKPPDLLAIAPRRDTFPPLPQLHTEIFVWVNRLVRHPEILQLRCPTLHLSQHCLQYRHEGEAMPAPIQIPVHCLKVCSTLFLSTGKEYQVGVDHFVDRDLDDFSERKRLRLAVRMVADRAQTDGDARARTGVA